VAKLRNCTALIFFLKLRPVTELHCPNLRRNFTCLKLKDTSFSTSIMAKSASHKRKGTHLPTQTGGATKRNRTADSSSILSGSVQPPVQPTQSHQATHSRRATVQTEEEDEASHGEDAEVIKDTEPDAAQESSESEAEASEDELGK